MKKTTPQKLSKRIAQYGSLSMAIAGVSNASGEIIYTDIADTGGLGISYNLDLDGDGTIDFKIEHSYYSSGYINDLLMNRNFNTQNGVLGSVFSGPYTSVYPFALGSTTLISSNSNSNWIDVDGNMYLNLRSCGYLTNSNWCDGESEVTDKFLGLRFEISGNIHYGWARLAIGANPSNWLITDYAYEETAGIDIRAGEQPTAGIDDNVFSNIKIIALNKSIALYNLPQTTNYRLFNLNGQSVLDGKINNDT